MGCLKHPTLLAGLSHLSPAFGGRRSTLAEVEEVSRRLNEPMASEMARAYLVLPLAEADLEVPHPLYESACFSLMPCGIIGRELDFMRTRPYPPGLVPWASDSSGGAEDLFLEWRAEGPGLPRIRVLQVYFDMMFDDLTPEEFESKASLVLADCVGCWLESAVPVTGPGIQGPPPE